jgi:hypothetical protein
MSKNGGTHLDYKVHPGIGGQNDGGWPLSEINDVTTIRLKEKED